MIHIQDGTREGQWAICGAFTNDFERKPGSRERWRPVTCPRCIRVREDQRRSRMKTLRKDGKLHHIAEDGICLECGVRHTVACRTKWTHEHHHGHGMILVRGRTSKGEPWSVYITDDGSICPRYVTPHTPHPIGLPNRPAIHRTKDPIGSHKELRPLIKRRR